jgi:hypothetical protein
MPQLKCLLAHGRQHLLRRILAERTRRKQSVVLGLAPRVA